MTANPTGPELEIDAELVGSAADGMLLYLNTAEPLAPTDPDKSIDVYEYDLRGGLRHVSDGPGPDAEIGSWFTAASADGRRVVFETEQQLAAGDTDAAHDLYERTPTGALVAASDSATGPDQNLNAHLGALSRDGTRLYINAFDPLAPGDTDDQRDLYLSRVVPDPPPIGGAPAPQRDTTPPRLTRIRYAGGKLRFRLSEPADVQIVVRKAARCGSPGAPPEPTACGSASVAAAIA